MTEYFKDYEAIRFRVEYSIPCGNPEEINFAAQPYEEMDSDEMANDPNLFSNLRKARLYNEHACGVQGFCL